MKNLKLILILVKFNFILLVLLINSGCATHALVEKAESHTLNEFQHDVIHQITAAYLTSDRSLRVCLRGLYEGDPPEQEYSLEIPAKKLIISQSVTLSRSQIISGCPYNENIHSKTWTPVKIGFSSLESEISSLRPLSGTNETIYEQRVEGKSEKRMVYTSRDPHSTDEWIVIDIYTEPVIRRKMVDSKPWLYLFLPVTVAVDVVASPLYLAGIVAFFVKCSFNSRCSSWLLS